MSTNPTGKQPDPAPETAAFYQIRHEGGLKTLLGCLAVFASAFFFYLSTLVIRWSQSEVAVQPAFFVFARFLLGFVVVCTVMAVKRHPIKPVRYHLLIGRTLANCVAVYCFYVAVTRTTVAEANILNMTYPLYIAVFSRIFLKDQRGRLDMVLVGTAFIGIWLIVNPGAIQIKADNLWGVCSGICASAAMLYLNFSRKYHDTHTILFFMFGLGSVLIYILFHNQIFLPGPTALFYLFFCALFGIGGQYLLTLGFRYVTAVEGSVISSTRILLAALFGPMLASDPHLSIYGWLGAFLIFIANVFLAFRKAAASGKAG